MQDAVSADQVRAMIDASYTETEFQAQVIKLAETIGWRVSHFHDSRRQVGDKFVGDSQAKGFPDLVLVRGDVLIFAELKSEKGSVTIDQDFWIGDLRRAGQDVYVWRPSDWPDIEQVLT